LAIITVGNVTGDVGTSDPQLTGLLADGISNTGVGLASEAVSFSRRRFKS